MEKMRIYGIYLFLSLVAVFLIWNIPLPLQAQNDETESNLYLIFEFMEVDNEQESAYNEIEQFWKKIHKERVKSGEILGWDLWSLQPGGEDQGYQYMTVTLFDDPAKMMGDQSIFEHAQKAYPDMSESDLLERFNKTGKSRDLAVRLYLQEISTTESDFELSTGMVATIDLMKVKPGSFEEYEKAENEIFKPLHQQAVTAGNQGSWGLLRVMSPIGSDTYTSHITVNMFSGWDQFFSEGSGYTPTYSDEILVGQGLETREMKWSYLATLREMVRQE